jgi:hypothetical protein
MQRTRRVAVPFPAGLSDALRAQTHPRVAAGVAASFASRGETAATLLLWAIPPMAEGATPLGTATVRWAAGGADAMIERIGWGSASSETEVWRALSALVGEPLGLGAASGHPRVSAGHAGGDGHPRGRGAPAEPAERA